MKVISLFSGCGGFDLGFVGGFKCLGRRYPKNGVEIVLACDFVAEACAVYAENLGPIRCADVRGIDAWPTADVLIGGPPCQPFSTASRKQLGADDERNMVPEFVRAVGEVKPTVFLMENVAGLRKTKKSREYFAGVLEELAALGYRVEYRVLNAADFGVPQTRERLIVQGVRLAGGKLPRIHWPTPTHARSAEGKLRPWRTVRDALDGIEAPIRTRTRRQAEGEHTTAWRSGGRRQIADRPFFTVSAEATFNGYHLVHPWYNRPLLIAEIKRAQSFPDDFIVVRKARALGNAVPPVFAWHLARAVKRTWSGALATP